MGRTGMVGRGLLRRWGPNHAADPIATRYYLISAQYIYYILGLQRQLF